nr:ionotropic receptor 25a [Matsumurasca onukii]
MAERENVVDFTVPFYDLVGISILMKKPMIPTSLFKFLSVLEKEVWLCILSAYFLTSLLMWVFDRWSPYSYQNNREKYKDDEEKREFNLKECLWFCMTSLTPQGGGEAPKNLSGRLVAATWWLFGFIIIASYTANLAAFLTVSRLDTPIESLDGLSKQYKILYAPLQDSSTETYFKRMSEIESKFYEIWKEMSLNDSLSEIERSKLAVWDYPVSDKYTKMWQAMQEAKPPQTLEEAVQRVRDSPSSSEGFAYLGDATDIKYLVMTNCDLQQVGDEFSRKPYAIAVQQGSALKEQLNSAILQLLNQRDLEKLKEKWWNNNKHKETCQKQDDQSDGISINNIGGVFIVIFVGIGLSCVTLAFEYWWYKYRKPKVVNPQRRDPAEFPTKHRLRSLAADFPALQQRHRFRTLDSRMSAVHPPIVDN